MKRMLINATHAEEVRIALVDGQKLYDLDIENRSREQKKASIYKAKITRVEPSLEAAFVDFGSERHGFLPLKEIAREYFKKRMSEGGQRTPIKELVREGQEILVQVDKEERGNKGAALTTFISLAGRYMVLMPNNPRAGGISRRIEGEDRDELREALSHLDIPDGMGVIVRTAGVGRSAEELQWDLAYLLQLWQAIGTANSEEPTPALLYQENSAVLRAIRDNLRHDIGEVLIEGEEAFSEASSFIAQVMPHYKEKVKPYADPIPLFNRYQIESQIESAFEHTVKLPSGGSIVIDPTEALVSVDVNSARATKGADIEETALNTNLEAADEVTRQLRIRDIGGLIVIDFIDMMNQKNQRAVENRMRDALEADRARVQVSRISRFGLMEMSRQRLRPSLEEISTILCPRCNGQGRIRDTKSLALAVLRIMEEESLKERSAVVRVQVPLSVGAYLLNEKRQDVTDIEQRTNTRVMIIPSSNLETPHYIVERLRDDHLEEEGTVPSYILSELANRTADPEMPSDGPVAVQPKAAVQAIPPQLPPPTSTSTSTAQPVAQPATKAASLGFWSKLAKSLFSDEVISEPSSKAETQRKASTSRKEQDKGKRTSKAKGDRPRGNSRDNSSDKKDSAKQGRDRNRGENNDKVRGTEKSTDDNASSRPSDNQRQQEGHDNKSQKDAKGPRQSGDVPRRERNKKTKGESADQPDKKRNTEPRATVEERTPSKEALKGSKREPKRNRSEPRAKPAIADPKSVSSTAAASTGVEIVAKPVVETPKEPAKPRGRAANDPRNRGKAPAQAAQVETVSDAVSPAETVSAKLVDVPAVELPKVVEANSATNEPAVQPTPTNEKVDITEQPDSRPQPSPETVAKKENIPTLTTRSVQPEKEKPSKVQGDADKADTVEKKAPEEAMVTPRASRASNDPRVLRRQQREEELKAQGIMSKAGKRPDAQDNS